MSNKQNYPINVLSFELPNKRTFFTPLSDLVFRSIFGDEGSEHITKAFLESVLKIKIEDFSLRANPEFLRKHIFEKKQTADVKAVCNNSKDKILIEMQYKAVDDVNNRFTTYSEKAHSQGLTTRSSYTKLPRVIMVIIMGENLPALKGKKDYISVFNDREKDCPEFLFSDGVTKYVIELPKYIKQKNEASEKDREKIINPWLEFLIDPLGEEVEKSMRSIKELREAVEKLRELNADEEVVEIYEAEEWAKYDRNSALESAEVRGIEKGKAEGEKETKRSIVLKMLKKKYSIEDISTITNVSANEIKEMQKSSELVS